MTVLLMLGPQGLPVRFFGTSWPLTSLYLLLIPYYICPLLMPSPHTKSWNNWTQNILCCLLVMNIFLVHDWVQGSSCRMCTALKLQFGNIIFSTKLKTFNPDFNQCCVMEFVAGTSINLTGHVIKLSVLSSSIKPKCTQWLRCWLPETWKWLEKQPNPCRILFLKKMLKNWIYLEM